MNNETGLKIFWLEEWGAVNLVNHRKMIDQGYSNRNFEFGFEQSLVDYEGLEWLDYFSGRFPELRFWAREEIDWVEMSGGDGLFKYYESFPISEVPVITLGVNYIHKDAVSVEEWVHLLFHEIGHHVTRRFNRQGMESEFIAWKWAEREMKKFGLVWNNDIKMKCIQSHIETPIQHRKLMEELNRRNGNV